MARLMIISAMILAAVAMVYGYGSGAPAAACSDMIPQHHKDPETSPFPYIVTTSKKQIKAGDKVTITITVGPTVKEFKGFMIQARVGGTPVGIFTAGQGVKVVDCGNGQSNAATHENPNAKTKIAVEWTAPPKLGAEVFIHTTVAKHGQEYWTNKITNKLAVKS